MKGILKFGWWLVFVALAYDVSGQCSLISTRGSRQNPSSVCSPVNFSMDVGYKFLLPIDPALVEVMFVWNDGFGSRTIVPAMAGSADSVFASASHFYPPTTECARTAQAFLIYDGDTCTSQGYQEQTFSTWGTDEENGAVLETDPVVYYVCEGDPVVDVRFDDASTFNCNIAIEPDLPNRYYRWVQFQYNTFGQAGDRIPSVVVTDNGGVSYPMTDGTGAFISDLEGPIVRIPIPADGPNQTSYRIDAPAGGVAGDIFELTLRNWNVCNRYDNNPEDGVPPANIVDGDNPPIITRARIEIIATPPVVPFHYNEYCAGDPILLTAGPGIATIRWYADSALTNLIYVGPNFNPVLPPFSLNNMVPGTHTFYVTATQGACESAPDRIDIRIFANPNAPNAGADREICADTAVLNGNIPSAGIGYWTTSGIAIIDDSTNRNTVVRNLQPGPNVFTWNFVNGPCVRVDNVVIYRDLPPSLAHAGTDQVSCNGLLISLAANVPASGTGTWTVVSGSGTFSDIHSPVATVSGPSAGVNHYVWSIRSLYNECPASRDTVALLYDLLPGVAMAGPDALVCDTNQWQTQANAPVNGGYGSWFLLSGSLSIVTPDSAITNLTGITYGINTLTWTVSSLYGVCPTTTDTLVVSRYPQPDDAVAGPDQLLCTGYSAILAANTPVTGSGRWLVAHTPMGVSPVFSPNTLAPDAVVTISAGNEGLYAFVWEITNGSCVKTDTIWVDFGTLVTAYAGVDDTLCGSTRLLIGSNPAPGTAAWSILASPAPGLFLPTANNDSVVLVTGPTTNGTYTLLYTVTSGSCPPASDTVLVTFYPLPGLPTALDDSACGASSFVINASPGTYGDEVLWYSDAAGTLLVHIGGTYTTPLLTNTTTYYLASRNSVTGCQSGLTPVRMRIDPVPDVPVPMDASRCGPGAAVLISSIGLNGDINQWYDAPVAGTLVSRSQHYFTIASADLHLFVSSVDTLTGCESPRVAVDFIVHTVPDLPLVSGAEFCGPSNTVLTSSVGAGGQANRWYDAPVGGVMVSIDTFYSTSLLDTTTSFWVSTIDTTTGCESPRAEARVVIHPIPGLPMLTDGSRCGAGSVTLYGSPGTGGDVVRWFDFPSGGALLAQQDSFVAPYLTVSRSYYTSTYQTATGCESGRSEAVVHINPVPSPIFITGLTDVEQGASGIYFVNYVAGSTYQWDVPAGIILDEDNGYFVRLSFPTLGSFTLTAQELSFAGCPGVPAHKLINVRERTLDAEIVLSSPNGCTGTQMQVLADVHGGTPPFNYLWTGDVASLSSTHIANPLFDASATGHYTLMLQVTDVNGNVFADTANFEVFPSPAADIETPDTLVCAGDMIMLDVEVTGNPVSVHRWSGDVGYLTSLNVQWPQFKPLSAGSFRLYYEATDVHGCKASDSVLLSSEKPAVQIVTDAIPGCSPLVVDFGSILTSVVSTVWDFGDGTFSGLTSATHTYTNTSSAVEYRHVVLTGTSARGCRATDDTYITVWPNPANTVTLTPDSSCSPATVMLTAIPGATLYRWNMGDGTVFNGGYNVFHTFVNTTTTFKQYSVILESVNGFGCSSSASALMTIFPSPDAEFSYTPSEQMFPDATVSFDNLTQGEWDYRWYFGDGSTSVAEEPGNHTYEFPNNFIVSLVAYNAYCSDSALGTVKIIPHPPVAKFAPVDPGCMPLSVTFVNASEFADSYLWDFGDGNISTVKSPSYTYYHPGKYTIKLSVSGKGGTDATADSTEVYILPNSFFDLAPRYVFVNDEPVQFFNQAENADIIEWDFGDGNTSVEQNPTHTYKTAGTYDVTLKVWTVNGCFDLYVMESAVFVKPPGEIGFPNAFRPDSPLEENRVFLPGVVDNVTDYHLMIYNRWGQLLFESFDQNVGWDGYYQGALAKQEVYIWRVEGTYSDGTPFVKVGDVTLLR